MIFETLDDDDILDDHQFCLPGERASNILSDVTPSESVSERFELSSSQVISKGKKRTNHSDVWEFFDRKERKCHSCGIVFSKTSSNSTLYKHLRKCDKRYTQTTLSLARLSESDKEMSKKLLLNFILSSLSPFNLVENDDFIKYITFCDPRQVLPSRGSLMDSIDNIFKEEKEKKINELAANNSKFSLTCDGWTSLNSMPFFAITIHYVDSNYVLRDTVLSLSSFPHPHSALSISERIRMVCEEYGIQERIFCVTTDSAANMIKSIKLFNPNCNHFKCVAHILNLAAKIALKDFDKYIQKLRNIILSIRRSSSLTQKLQLSCDVCSVKNLKLVLDVETRWNSTFEMIKRALELKNPLLHVCSSHDTLESMNDTEWSIISMIAEILKPLKIVTEELSQSKFPTIGQAYSALIYLQQRWEPFKSDTNFSTTVNSIMEKIVSCFDTQSNFFLLSCILDPRIKTKHFSSSAPFRNLLDIGLEEYEDSNVENGFFGKPCTRKSFMDELNLTNDIKESEAYLLEPCCPSQVDILSWWKLNEPRFPRLSKMARDYFGAMSTSTASERTFSLSGRIITKIRSRITAENAEKSALLNIWNKN